MTEKWRRSGKGNRTGANDHRGNGIDDSAPDLGRSALARSSLTRALDHLDDAHLYVCCWVAPAGRRCRRWSR